MTTQETSWRRDSTGLGLWPHQGKVAITGWGHSPVDRRWDGVTMDTILGAYAILAVRRALDDAGVKPEEVDGLLCCPDNMAGFNVAGPRGTVGTLSPISRSALRLRGGHQHCHQPVAAEPDAGAVQRDVHGG